MIRRFALALFVAAGAAALQAQDFKLGSQVTDFQLTELNGSPVQYSALKGNITVVMFISVQCPVSNAYNDRMIALYREFEPKGVKFVFINANRTEPAAAVMEHARAHNFPFAVYKDEGNIVADKFGASVTPEAYVMDSTGTIRYHGSIDDSKDPTQVTSQRLKLALDAVLAGKQPPQQETKAFGCTIKRVQKAA